MVTRQKSFFLTKEAVEELNCCICYESKPLHLLPCQHRLCGNCIEQLAYRRLRVQCPTCRNNYSIPLGGFPLCRLTQYFREQLQDLDSTNQNREKTACKYCENVVEARCQSCSAFLCYKCVSKTRCDENTEGHQPLDLVDLTTNAQNVLEVWKKKVEDEVESMIKKMEHKKKVLKLYSAMTANNNEVEKIQFVENMTLKKTTTIPEANPESTNESEIEEYLTGTSM
ncbi:hypothetical protein EB796_017530 [Bugula neritina]|uniref:RING-type domain-containing protein n=1 Tax=Bugula neritina TaxID=10212 RepID=A0A7J7JDG6_BUGNE|nr:hypothetical protein EB796_017530 [Bugula neritina]